VRTSDQDLIAGTLRAFRRRCLEPQWERLDAPSEARYQASFRELHELGVTSFALPEEDGGVALDPRSRFEVLRELGAGVPALAFGLVSHATSLALLVEVAGDRRLVPLLDLAAGARLALAASPLDRAPDTPFELASNGTLSLSGVGRAALAYPNWLVVPARQGDSLRLCVVRADAPGVRFSGAPSGHGLRLIPCGELAFGQVAVSGDRVLEWPASGRAANQADGLIAALLAGITAELADRAMRYALERYQGGKMIHEHDAVRELVGPAQLARRVLEALAVETLSASSPGDGGASAFAIDVVRQCGLDAIQTLGGYGYMEGYRVERYLRDANTLETCWIHAAARRRQIAKDRFRELAQEGP